MFVLFAEFDSPINSPDDCRDIRMEDEPREQDNVSICNRMFFLNGSFMFNNYIVISIDLYTPARRTKRFIRPTYLNPHV